MKPFIILLFLTLMFNVNGQQNELSERQKTADFQYLYGVLANNYPYFGILEREKGIDWLSKKEEYTERIKKTKTDSRFLIEIESILRDLNCKHTDLSPTRHVEKFRAIYGEVCLVNSGYTHWMNVLNHTIEKTRYWSNILSDKNNYTTVSRKQKDRLSEDTHNYKDTITPDGKIAIMRITSFEVKHIINDLSQIDYFLKNLNQTDYLIIDLQGNKGGTTAYWMDGIVSRLISSPMDFRRNLIIKDGITNRNFYPTYFQKGEIIKRKNTLPQLPDELSDGTFLLTKETTIIFPDYPVNFSGKIYILMDGQTFSSADEFAQFSKATGWATTTGSTTGGGGIGSDPALIQLPESGIIIRYPALTGLNPDGSMNMETCTTPDIPIDGKNADDRLNNLIQYIKQSDMRTWAWNSMFSGY